MKIVPRVVLLLTGALVVSACVHSPPPKNPDSHKKLKLETIDHGPMRPKTYLYREVDDPAVR